MKSVLKSVMQSVLGASVLAICLTASTSHAAAPKVSGTYGITVYTECGSIPEGTAMGVGTMAFGNTPSSTANVSIHFQWYDRRGNGTIKKDTRDMSGKLKLTATTFAIGDAPSGPMSFGGLDADGVAHTLNFLWTDFDPDFNLWCLHTLNATRQ